MNFAAILQLLFNLAPAILQTVNVIEQAAPQSGLGKQKLDTVLSIVNAAASSAPQVAGDAQGISDGIHAGNADVISQGIAHIVTDAVSFFNRAGIFQKAAIVRNAPVSTPAPKATQTVASGSAQSFNTSQSD